jgi:hypothetical protein
MEDFQLEKFLSACEAARDAGDGYASVTLTFSNYAATDITGTFTVKPRRDQSGLLRRGK